MANKSDIKELISEKSYGNYIKTVKTETHLINLCSSSKSFFNIYIAILPAFILKLKEIINSILISKMVQ